MTRFESVSHFQHISSRRHKDRAAGKPAKPKYSPYSKPQKGQTKQPVSHCTPLLSYQQHGSRLLRYKAGFSPGFFSRDTPTSIFWADPKFRKYNLQRTPFFSLWEFLIYIHSKTLIM